MDKKRFLKLSVKQRKRIRRQRDVVKSMDKLFGSSYPLLPRQWNIREY